MNVPIETPGLEDPQAGRAALERVALEGYRAGRLGRAKVGELLGLSFYETEAFLKNHGAEIKLTMEEFRESSSALEELINR